METYIYSEVPCTFLSTQHTVYRHQRAYMRYTYEFERKKTNTCFNVCTDVSSLYVCCCTEREREAEEKRKRSRRTQVTRSGCRKRDRRRSRLVKVTYVPHTQDSSSGYMHILTYTDIYILTNINVYTCKQGGQKWYGLGERLSIQIQQREVCGCFPLTGKQTERKRQEHVGDLFLSTRQAYREAYARI